MSRLLAFLIISVLFTQSAWAFHDVEINHSQEHAYSQSSDHHNFSSDDYDHCGHASAHLVAIVTNQSINFHTGNKSNPFSISNTLSSISYQPPVPPPNA